MSSTARPTGARSSGLTRDQIVEVAIRLLDTSGEAGLTFRALALELKTGHGAIQWHVTNKSELLMSATAATLEPALAEPGEGASPRDAVRAIALGVFAAIEQHPWLGSQLFAAPWQSAMVRLWEQLARPVEELGVPADALFTAVSTLVHYIVGAGGQNAANPQILPANADRQAFLDRVAGAWESRRADEGSLIRRLAAQLREHDDRAEFLAGVDIILDGLEAA